ncbi:hypothetical protein JNUCC1_02182 [Lentibacillus sp. JNUCC-1]|nr:YfhD family protein [Lentibacillus sp. JNUCC-1]MUV38344.1 hypothetical protein [Lentibacillus sp. JNUCC-1]
MGRDEHKKSKGRNIMAQTPKQELTDGADIEFSTELADSEDQKALARRKAADQRNKTRN